MDYAPIIPFQKLTIFLYETIDGRRLKTISKMDFEIVNENHDKLAIKKIGDAGRNIP